MSETPREPVIGSSPAVRSCSVLVTAGAWILFCIFLFKMVPNAVNFPNADDFDVYLDFLNRFFAAPSAAERLALLFERHTQHYQVLDRTLALALLTVNGSLDFRVMVVAGLLWVPIFLLLLPRAAQQLARGEVIFLGAALLLTPLWSEAALWATTAWQFQWVHVFTVAGMIAYLGTGGGADWGSTAIAAALFAAAALSQGNGALAPLCLGAVLLLSGRRKQSVPALLFGVVLLLALHRHGTALLDRPGIPWTSYADYFFCLGGAVSAFDSPFLPRSIGVLLLCVGLAVSLGGGMRQSPVLCAFLLFLWLSALGNAVARVDQGVHHAYATGRYHLVALLILLTTLLTVLSSYRATRPWRLALLALAAAFWIFNSVRTWAEPEFRAHYLRERIFLWHEFGGPLPYPADEQRAQHIFRETLTWGTFHPPSKDPLFGAVQSQLQPEHTVPPASSSGLFSLETQRCHEGRLYLSGWLAHRRLPEEIGMALCSGSSCRTFIPHLTPRPDVKRHLTQKGRTESSVGFYALIDDIPAEVIDTSLKIFDIRTGTALRIQRIGPTVCGLATDRVL